MEEVNIDISEIEEDLSISRGEKPEMKWDFTKIGESKVTDEDGTEHKFRDLYDTKKTLVIFIRHFLCFIGKEYCDDLALIPRKYFKDADVNLVVVGCGPHKFIKSFREITGYKGPLVVDPERLLYKQLGFYGSEKKFNEAEASKPKPSCHVKSNFVSGVLKSTWRGMKDKEFQGDLNQQGGALIIGPGDVIHHHHFDTAAYDHAPINDLLQLSGVQHVNFPKDARVLTV